MAVLDYAAAHVLNLWGACASFSLQAKDDRPVYTDLPALLVVDDDADIRATLTLICEDEGYRVQQCPDGLVALHLLRTTAEPYVIICDYQMPRLDGFGLWNFVQADPELAARHRFIFITATNRVLPPMFVDQLRTEHVPVVRKPFEIHELFSVIEKVATSGWYRDTISLAASANRFFDERGHHDFRTDCG